MNIYNKCEVCNSSNLESVLDLGSHPLCDDLLPIGSNDVCKEYSIEILFCKNCNTAHQKYQVPKRQLFQPTYHYRARMTGSVLSGMEELVDTTEKMFGALKGKKVVDIGCNDGSLLNFFKGKGMSTVGVEPTDAAKDSNHVTYNAFFDNEICNKLLLEHQNFDFITFTNVFAHIENLPELISNLKKIISPKTVLIIENHYLGDILSRGQFDSFYHEHPRTYSYRSFEFIAKQLDLEIISAQFVSRYGGNIRVFLGKGAPCNSIVDESNFLSQFNQMRLDLESWKAETKNLINNLVKAHGKLRAKAFPGRAAILIKLLNLSENEISAVYEIKGSFKTGHYVPGTKIPILPEADLFNLDKSQPIINLAWHIPSEVRANLEKNGYLGKVIDIKNSLNL